MKLSIEGTPEEIKNALQAICGSEEREKLKLDVAVVGGKVNEMLANKIKPSTNQIYTEDDETGISSGTITTNKLNIKNGNQFIEMTPGKISVSGDLITLNGKPINHR